MFCKLTLLLTLSSLMIAQNALSDNFSGEKQALMKDVIMPTLLLDVDNNKTVLEKLVKQQGFKDRLKELQEVTLPKSLIQKNYHLDNAKDHYLKTKASVMASIWGMIENSNTKNIINTTHLSLGLNQSQYTWTGNLRLKEKSTIDMEVRSIQNTNHRETINKLIYNRYIKRPISILPDTVITLPGHTSIVEQNSEFELSHSINSETGINKLQLKLIGFKQYILNTDKINNGKRCEFRIESKTVLNLENFRFEKEIFGDTSRLSYMDCGNYFISRLNVVKPFTSAEEYTKFFINLL